MPFTAKSRNEASAYLRKHAITFPDPEAANAFTRLYIVHTYCTHLVSCAGGSFSRTFRTSCLGFPWLARSDCGATCILAATVCSEILDPSSNINPSNHVRNTSSLCFTVSRLRYLKNTCTQIFGIPGSVYGSVLRQSLGSKDIRRNLDHSKSKSIASFRVIIYTQISFHRKNSEHIQKIMRNISQWMLMFCNLLALIHKYSAKRDFAVR